VTCMTKGEFNEEFKKFDNFQLAVKKQSKNILTEMRNNKRYATHHGIQQNSLINNKNDYGSQGHHGQSYSYIPNDKILKIL